MPTFYSIWKTTKRDGNQPKKMNMTVAQATTYIVKNRDSLKQGEQFFTENQATNEVDMMFTKRDTITPNKPMWLDGNRLVEKNPKTNPQKSMSNYNNPAWSIKNRPDTKNGINWQKEKKIDALAKKMRLTNKQTDKMTDRTFYAYTIGKQNEQLTEKQYERFQKLFKDSKFNRPNKPLKKYPSAFEVYNKKEKDFQNYLSKAKPRPNMIKPKKSRGKWVGNMFKLSNSRLSQLGKTGTPKQKKLAKSIIAKRRKN